MTKKFLLLASILGGFYTASSQVSFTSGDVKATLGTRFMADAVYYADDSSCACRLQSRTMGRLR